METKILKSINLIRCVSGANMNLFRNAAMVLVLLTLGVGNAWAGHAYMRAKTNSTGQGLVYVQGSSSTSTIARDKYHEYSPGSGSDNSKDYVDAGSGIGGGPYSDCYMWALPARGYVFDKWSGYETKTTGTGGGNPMNTNASSWDGVNDNVQGTAGGGASTNKTVIANFKEEDSYQITYSIPVGGSYSVSYAYWKTRAGSSNLYEFYKTGENYTMEPTSTKAEVVKTYLSDELTYTASGANFEGWYEGTTQKSTNTTYTSYKANKTTTFTAVYKTATLGEASGNLSPSVDAGKASELVAQNNLSVTVPVSAYGTWAVGDFIVTFTEKTTPARGDITKGTVTYTTNSGDVLSSAGTLTIPFTYSPTSFGGTEVEVTITPKNNTCVFSNENNTKKFTILASANKVLNYEACILLGEEEEPQDENTGTLAEMVALANTMDSKPKVQLAKNCTIAAPLSLTKSMTFDLNDKTLTSTGESAFSIAAQGIDVQIVDNGFSQLGTIAVSSAQSGNVSVAAFTQKAKLTMQGGTLSATNTGSGSAYGINVTQGSTFYMTNGQLNVTGVSEAQGVHVATASDYATLNGGSITVTAPAQAYGVWSAGQSNVTGATIAAETTTGANAYGVYVNGSEGVSTLTTCAVTATAKTTGAYAAYVNAGRLNGNGGSFAAEAVASGVYGVHVVAGAEAMLQMNAVVTAEATGANGTSVFGVNNLGTVSLTNVSVTATSPTTAATAVNTASSATSTTIEGGTYRADAAGGTAYGIYHQHGTLSMDGGSCLAFGSGNSIYGVRAAEEITIANATLHGETQSSGNTAYGFCGETAGKNYTLTNCTIKGISATSKAYAIKSNSNVSATNCTLIATTTNANEAYGLYAADGTNTLTNCNAIVTANTVQAYGVNHVSGSLTIEGGQYDVTANQTGQNSEQSAQVYGIYNAANKTTNVSNATFNVSAPNYASSKDVYGVYAKGILNSTNTTFDVEGRTKVRGIYAENTLTLSGNTIEAKTKNGGDCYGIYAKKGFTFTDNAIRATATTTSVYALFFDATNSEGTIADGKYYAMGNGTTAFAPLNDAASVGKVKIQGGVYSTIVNLDKYLVSGYNIYNLDNEHPDFATGHRFIVADENPTPYVCYIKGGNKYTSLEAAMQYAKDNSGNYTIIMTQDYTLPEGDYELPSNATLLVPRNADQTSISGGTPARRTTKSITVENLRLTLASGAHINVNGKIEVGGEMFCAETGQICYVCSEYGRIHMEEGSLIQLNSGAVLYAWGYITGKGEIKAKNNSEVHEMFQIGDMKSMSNIGYYYYGNNEKFFLINQYYIQNVEVPTTYYYNSRLISAMASYYNYKFMGDDNINLVGTSGALFLVTTNDESSWVRKSYDAEHDYQVWDVNSKAQLGSITINFKEGVPVLGSAEFNSSSYYLPITNNMKIHVLDGDFSVTQTSELLPGASVEIDKTASFTINSGKNVYVFDNDQWPFAITQVVYSPSWKNGTKPTRTKADAAVNVHGQIIVKGGLFTSSSITDGTNATNGANIYSNNEDAGTVSYSTAATASSSVKWVTGLQGSSFSTSAVYKTISMESAKLKNNDGSYTATAGTASGEAWIYLDNVWQKTYTNGCFEVIGSTVYAKPSGYVALKKSQTVSGKLKGVEETNHTYLTADDKILILMDECQWWEVVATSDPAVFECKKEGYEGFYFYNTSTSKWELKTVTVTFYQNETGSTVLKNIVTNYNGIPDQAVIATNPTKGTTDEFTYSFYGWKSSVTGTEYKWTDPLEVATADMSYRPVFTATKRNYTITLVNANNGANVPLEVPYGETPEYTPKKDATAQYTYTFNGWSPAFTTVTGTATYTAQWLSTVNEYNITWKNGNEILEVDENQPYGTITSFGGATPTKDADNNYAYAFSGWHNSLTNAPRANNETVTGAIIYTAQYNTTPRYAVTFNNYDGTQLDCIIYTQGETPAYGGVPARKRDDNGYFKFIGWKNSNGTDYAANAVLPAVSKKETYTAQYEYVTDFFTITLNNVDGNGATWSGKFGEGAIPFYNPNDDDVPVTPTKTSADPKYSYVFNGWSLSDGGTKLDPTPAVTEDATYWALFEQVENKYTVSFTSNNDAWGIVSRDDVKEVPYGTAITVNGNTLTVNGKMITATPAAEDAQYMYIFERWESIPGTVTGTTNIQAVFKAYVATVEAGGNTTYHTTVADAFTTANTLTNNPTVTMYKNASTASEIVITKSMTIDLNGKTISSTLASATGVFNINASGKTITIKDSDTGGKIDHTASYSGKLYGINFTAGSLDIIGGTIYAKNTTTANNTNYRAYGIYPNGGTAITMSSGAIEAHTPNNPSPFGIYSEVACTFTMTGGTIIANGMSAARGIYVKGTTNLTDATITVSGSSSHTIFAVSGNMTINSGTYTTTGGGESYCIFHRNNAITINGGYFNTPNKLYKRDTNGTYTGTITLKGGCYSNDVELADKCASGYQVFALTDAEKAEVGSDYNYKVTTTFTVTFNANGHGTPPVSQVIEKGKKATEPAAPTAEGYTFGGWYKEAGCTNPWDFNSDVVNANTTLFAKWTANPYTITFDSNGGSEVASITQGYGTAVTAPAAPSKTGYTFNGWSPAVPSTMPVNGLTCVAQWTVNPYTITFDSNGGSEVASITQNYGTAVTAPADPSREGYTFDGWSPSVPSTMPVNGLTCVAQWTVNPYTITFDSNGGSAVASITQNYGTAVTAPADPSREGYTFDGWSPTVPETMPLNGETCVAQWTINSELDVVDHEIVTVSENATVVTTIVHEGGNLNVESGTLTTDVLIVEASASNSGQITGAGNVEVTASTGKAYFDLTLNTAARHWHAFGVPWNVNVTENPITEVETGRTLVVGRDCEIVYYNGATRAAQGPGSHCWNYLKHYTEAGQPVEVMTPGKGYMIAFTSAVQTVRLTKAAGAPIFFGGTNSVVGGSGEDGGWNAIANPMAYHATLNAGPTVGYVHDGGEIGSDGYTPYDIDGTRYIVGKAVYVQAESDKSIVVAPAGEAGEMTIASAPRRAKATDKQYLALSDYYTVSLSNANGVGSKVYVLPEEDKADAYVIGHDLSQFSMSSKKPQVWVNRYDTKLALNTTAPVADVADFPISVYAPQANEYTISLASQPSEEYVVYLTQNGEAIWNLSDAPYVTSLPAGTNKTYGLRLTARKSPTIATGVDEAVVDAKNEIRKVLIDEKVFIIRGKNVYTIDGQMVK